MEQKDLSHFYLKKKPFRCTYCGTPYETAKEAIECSEKCLEKYK